MAADKVVSLRNVTKVINGNMIIRITDFHVSRSEICGLYGKNGSGKSMLLKLISGLVNCTTGTIEVFGEIIGVGGKMPKSTGRLSSLVSFLNTRHLIILKFLPRSIKKFQK